MSYELVPSSRNKVRKFPKARGPRPDHLETKQAEAIERQKDWAALTPQTQLAALDSRHGIGRGAQKQRKRLRAALNVEAKEVFYDVPTTQKKVMTHTKPPIKRAYGALNPADLPAELLPPELKKR